MADFISKVTLPNNDDYPIRASAIPYGEVDSTSTSTAFTATVPGVYELKDGVCVLLRNNVITSASGFTININDLGAKPAYTNMDTDDAPTRETTIFNKAYTMFFIYSSDLVEGGAWICYRGYNSDNNTIGYQLRTNNSTLPTLDKFYRYRILFTAADGKHWVPSNTSTSTNATAARNVNQRPIDPFREIVYYGTTTAIEANANVTAAQLWQQYAIIFGYSFNKTGAALTLTYPAPVYLKCTPQVDGSAIIDADTPYVQTLPTSKDGKIYIFLGLAYSATGVELKINHPIYYHDGTGIRLWTGKQTGGVSVFRTSPSKNTTGEYNISHYLNTKNVIVSILMNDGQNEFSATQSNISTDNDITYALNIANENEVEIHFNKNTAWDTFNGTITITILSTEAFNVENNQSLLRIG